MQIKHQIPIFLVLFLLAACSNQASRESFTTQQPSPTLKTVNDAPTRILTPTSTMQAAPTQTSTPTEQILPTPTSTLVDLENLPKLSGVIISPSDIKNNDELAWNPLILATNTTNELRDSCLWDCVKYGYSLEQGTLTIILLRAGDNQKAENTVENLRKEFLKTSGDAYIYTVNEIPNMPPKSWALVDAPSRTKDSRTGVSSIAYGSVVIVVTYSQIFCEYTPQFGRYCEGPVGDLVYISIDFLNWQMQKLAAAGYPK